MVVENEDVVAQIIEGGLQDTTRFIPLNKIQTFKLLSEVWSMKMENEQYFRK